MAYLLNAGTQGPALALLLGVVGNTHPSSSLSVNWNTPVTTSAGIYTNVNSLTLTPGIYVVFGMSLGGYMIGTYLSTSNASGNSWPVQQNTISSSMIAITSIITVEVTTTIYLNVGVSTSSDGTGFISATKIG